MKQTYTKKVLLNRVGIVLAILLIGLVGQAQNIAITDDDSYNADPSAMLDVKSLTKGLLIPRLDSVQRKAISSPADGLMVYDTDYNGFYYFNEHKYIWIRYLL